MLDIMYHVHGLVDKLSFCVDVLRLGIITFTPVLALSCTYVSTFYK